MNKYFFLFCFVMTSYFTSTNSIENKIEFKVNNEIITSIDIIKELNFLAALNPKILELDRDKIFEISKNSIIKEKIKVIELLKFKKKIEIEDKYLARVIRESYLKINLNSKNELLEHLSKYNLELKDFKKKITVETMWNQLIFSKFKSKVNINNEKIRSEIINNNNNIIVSLNLSEIIFTLNENQILNQKFKQIKKDINLNGFENTAMIHSISESANLGGKLGWINQNSLNQKLYKEIKNLNIDEITNPIVIPGGFLIIKLNKIKEIEKKINVDEEIEKQIIIKTNQQLNQYSNIYYNKIKKNIKIEKL